MRKHELWEKYKTEEQIQRLGVWDVLDFRSLFENPNQPPVFDRKVNLCCVLFSDDSKNDNSSGEEIEDLAAAHICCIAAYTVKCNWRNRWLTVAVCTWMVQFIIKRPTPLKMNVPLQAPSHFTQGARHQKVLS